MAANAKATAEEIGKLGEDAEARAYRCDVTDLQSVREMARRIRDELGEVDILVNNAGIMNIKELMDLTEEEIRHTIDVNCTSHFWTVREFLPSMMERNDGHIVTVASVAGLYGAAMLTDYCASKFAAIGFAEALREEMHRMKKNVIISIVCPFFVITNLITDHLNRIEMKLGIFPARFKRVLLKMDPVGFFAKNRDKSA